MTTGKYARVERERRFLLASFPSDVTIVRTRRIVDRYLDGTRLRLREMRDDDGEPVYKLTQKIKSPGPHARQGFITTMHLDAAEFRMLCELPGATLRKTRYSVPPFGIDVFMDALEGLVLAEAEFETALDAASLELPPYFVREVSEDERFTGGYLVRRSLDDLRRENAL